MPRSRHCLRHVQHGVLRVSGCISRALQPGVHAPRPGRSAATPPRSRAARPWAGRPAAAPPKLQDPTHPAPWRAPGRVSTTAQELLRLAGGGAVQRSRLPKVSVTSTGSRSASAAARPSRKSPLKDSMCGRMRFCNGGRHARVGEGRARQRHAAASRWPPRADPVPAAPRAAAAAAGAPPRTACASRKTRPAAPRRRTAPPARRPRRRPSLHAFGPSPLRPRQGGGGRRGTGGDRIKKGGSAPPSVVLFCRPTLSAALTQPDVALLAVVPGRFDGGGRPSAGGGGGVLVLPRAAATSSSSSCPHGPLGGSTLWGGTPGGRAPQ